MTFLQVKIEHIHLILCLLCGMYKAQKLTCNIVSILLQYDLLYFDIARVQLSILMLSDFRNSTSLTNTSAQCTGETVEVLTETACFLFGRPPFLLKCDCLSATFTSRIAMKLSYVKGRFTSNAWPSTEQKT